MESAEVPQTTTISTIAVQSGSTRIVIALLQSREWLELRVVEMTPGLALLGTTLAQATDMLASHQQVIAKIHSKQSPVEELLRQADQLIASQHTRAEVYTAMAESLSLAWQDVNTLLQRRLEILQLNVKYHSDAAVCLERTHALELACTGAPLPVQVAELRDLLSRLSEVKRSMLESLMAALQDGRALLDILRQVAAEGSLDSRPGQIKASADTSISQVEHWLEDLHDRRRSLEVSWQARKTQLEQCLALALLTTDLRMLEELLAERTEALGRNAAEVGDSAASAKLLLSEHQKLLPEAKELQEQGLKILRATEQLAATGHFAGEEAIAQAYQLLQTSAQYLELLDRRRDNLHDAVTFFDNAHALLSKLDAVDAELSAQSSMSASDLSQLQDSVSQICAPVLQQGYTLLEAVPGAKGVQSVVDELENRKLKLSVRCSALQEENLKVTQALNSFFEKYNQLYSWLVTTREVFQQGHQDMGSVLAVARDFLQDHHNILSNLQLKGDEINDFLLTVPDLLSNLEEAGRAEVHEKAESLRSQWSETKQVLEKRTELVSLYVKFHSLLVELASQLDSLVERLETKPGPFESESGDLEQQYNSVLQLNQQLDNAGDVFCQESQQACGAVVEQLAVERARLCVDSLRQHFSARVSALQTAWHTWQDRLITSRHTAQRWTLNMTESTKTVDWVSKLDGQLYPVLGDSQSVQAMLHDVEDKRDKVLTEIRRAQAEVQLRISTAEELLSQEPGERDEGVLKQLKGLQTRLQQVVADYQVLIEMFISFFKNLSELEHTVEGLESQYGGVSDSGAPVLADVDKALREHDASRQAIQELFKFAHTESLQIINKIRQQEPEAAAERDTDSVRRTLEGLRSAWQHAWTQHRISLEARQQLAQFDSDLLHIHNNLDELSQQLTKVKGQFGEDLAAAKATSLAFHYFEKTIELLEQRIETFMSAGDGMLKNKHSSSPHIQQELISLRSRWHQFHLQVTDTRRLIDLSLQYFALVQEAEDWFREGSRLLMTIAKRSSTIRTPDEANALLQEIELFLKPGESKQDERIQKISELAFTLYGGGQPNQLQHVKTESREMIDSFSQVSLELQQIINFLNKPPEEQQMEIVGLQEALPIDEKPAQKSPSPPPKKAKVEPEIQPPNFTLPLHDATIDEGSRFTFECRVSGIPMPEILWLKDNLSIDSNLDYHTKVEEDGLCSLSIEETFTEDSACFTCRATNLLGYAETTALLTVRENERESPPVFVRLLAPVHSKEGVPCSLVCKVEGTPLPTVQWYKDGVCVDSATEYTTTYNNGEAVLGVNQLRPADQGYYSCRATNRLGSETTAASLTVEPMISEKAPAFVTPLCNVMARAGQKLRLECEVSGVPEPQLEWSHNNKPLPDSRDIKILREGGKVVLTIPEAFPGDAGTYSLTASNSVGSALASCSVAVKGRLPAETSDSELASDPEPCKPSVSSALRDASVFEGTPARLDCVIVGQPEPEVIWYHEGEPVKESKEVQLLFQGDRCSLIIAETLPEDAGAYKVVAINSAGEASSSCHLTVHSLQKASPEPTEAAVSGSKPLFISLLTDALATEGDNITLECAVRGDPPPAISWSLNNHPLPPSDRFKIDQEPGGLCTLLISPVVAEDKGVYTARATNPLGEAKCFSHLIVKAATNLTAATTTDVHLEEKATVPAFTELFADRTVINGGSTKFECIVTGKPTPKVRWLYNNEPVSGKDFLASVSGARQVLTIPAVTPALAGGKVTCSAENEAGKASCSATLTVADIPPVDDLLSSIDQLNLSETSVFEMKREVFMQSSSLTQFGNGEPKVQVHGVASKTEQTSQKIGDQPAVQTESHKTSEYHSEGGVERKVDTQTHSTSQVEAGPGAVVPTRASTRRQLPPRFITPVMGKIVDQGADVTLECILEGYPTPSISWKKNGQEIMEGTSLELNKATCRLSSVSTDDAGKYSCTAINPVGTATCTADIVVKKNVFPPVFGRRLRPDTVESGRRTVLEAEVTGTPDPQITWYKDGQQIASASSMYRLLSQGNSHRLIIEEAGLWHSGRYEVRAVNSGGEARCSADLLILEPALPAQPAGMEMDFPVSSEFSSSKQTVSITESFKSDKKISLHVEHSTVPLDPLFDLPTLSIQPDKLTQSDNLRNVSKIEEKKVFVSKPKQEPQPFPTPQAPEGSQPLEESVIEDSSISKKSALSFFKNIIKENEEDAKVTKPVEPVKKSFVPQPVSPLEPILPPVSFESSLPESTFSQSSFQESSQKFESIYTSDGFFLQPEPPPEMGFISKSQGVKSKDDLADRVKKLEESHRALPQEQIPSGGVRIFPSPMQKISSETISTQTRSFPPQTQNSLSETISTQTSFQEGYLIEPTKPTSLVESSTFSEKKFESSHSSSLPHDMPVIKPFEPFKVTKIEVPKNPEPLHQEVISESFNSFQSSSFKTEVLNGGDFDIPKFDSLGPIVRPSADIQLRPQSPRPSAEGINMEKLWSSKQKEEYIEFPHASPIPVQQSQEHIQHFKSEKTSSFQEIKRTASPLPSATGLAMEKLWAPTADHPRPISALSTGERPKSPSAEGLAMDKLWAHKTSTQKKVWPPPQPKEENQIIPPWTNKATDSQHPMTADTLSEVSVKKESLTENNLKCESQSFSKTETSSFQSSTFSENVVKKGSAFKEVTPSHPVKPMYIPPPSVPPESKIIYVAETHASHSTHAPAVETQLLTTETNYMTSSQTMERTENFVNESTVVEEKVLRPSEAVKMWPPAPKEEKLEFQAWPPKQNSQSSFQRKELKKEFSSTITSDSDFDIPLEPGPPPEIRFAEPPPRRQSLVEAIEQNLEKNMEKAPSKHLAGAVRIIPPPPKKEKTFSKESTFQAKTIKAQEVVKEKQPYVPESISKPLPKLEPFPFKPDPQKSKPAKCPPPPRPSRFVKGSFTESDYESDCDSVKIAVKWNPWQSDSEDYSYRKVKPPAPTTTKRPHSATGQVVPPTEFEKPLPVHAPSPSIVTQPSEISKSAKSKIIKTEESHQKTISSREIKTIQNKTIIKPGSPPQFVEAPPPKHKPTTGKPTSPKTKQKSVAPVLPESGYMADTDEPSRQYKTTSRLEESMTRTEQSRVEVKTLSTTSNKTLAKKESLKSEVQSLTQNQDEPLEPFPFKPEPTRPAKRPLGPPPPSPSKFIKGEFRESDYESEYEGKIRPIWRPLEPADDKTFRPVRPILTPVSGKTQNAGRTPTPPTEFDEPPSFSGPPRPKFEPIDKPKQAAKVKEAVVEKTKVIRPTPVQAQAPSAPSPMETIYATPASKPLQEFVLKPGSPPRMDYAPPPGYVEKSNIVNFTESTASSKRVVSVQQTTRVMQFNNSSQNQVQRKENIPPKKFAPAFSKESDYESDVDGAVVRPVRTPYLDAENKRLKRVEEMKRRFLESEPQLQPGEPPEFAYSPDPSKLAYSAASKQMSEMTETFKGRTQKFVSDIMTDMKSSQKSTSDKSILKPPGDEPQTYRDENRLSEYGTKHIDPDTGLIYFKYDFGYEFGIVLPGEQKPGTARKVVSGPSEKEEGAVDFPIIHETTQKKKPTKVKTVKWEPTSESEMSEIESERVQRAPQLGLRTPSPHSTSPSLQSLSPYPAVSPGSPWLSAEPQVVRTLSPGDQPKKTPLFITPLRDIACVSGQPARFECIVLAEPAPSIAWSKDGSVLPPSQQHHMEYRNGVCRLTLPHARPFDAGQYACSATNSMGTAHTSASLQVPGERRPLQK